MSVALLFQFPDELVPRFDNTDQLMTRGWLVPVSGEESFYKYWYPVIEKEGYPWLDIIDPGLDLDAENLPEVLNELRQLQAAFPRYYTPDDKEYEYITRRIANLIAELEAVNPDDLASGKLELFLG
ncbi:hypothetical protein [Hymenobacter terrenus]|uniref:hypothetical protein n=1 Tax=Hymenobacter terrenus TaxID=1629124 RepID=UPI000B07CA6F|nr:hypothetical protein [Hymenobacter terrenus]